jgi:hypothetical protein
VRSTISKALKYGWWNILHQALKTFPHKDRINMLTGRIVRTKCLQSPTLVRSFERWGSRNHNAYHLRGFSGSWGRERPRDGISEGLAEAERPSMVTTGRGEKRAVAGNMMKSSFSKPPVRVARGYEIFVNHNVTREVSPLTNGYLTQASTKISFSVTFSILPSEDPLSRERHQGGVSNSTNMNMARTLKLRLEICASFKSTCPDKMWCRVRATERYDITRVNESSKEECLRYRIARRRSWRLQ